MPRTAAGRDAGPHSQTTMHALSRADRALVLSLQRRALQYFLDNQLPDGLMLDRQRNHGPAVARGLVGTATTGMGLIALALASSAPYRLLKRSESVERVRAAIETALNVIDHDHGMLPHFLDSASGIAVGSDAVSTVDTSWLVAGGLWAAAFLRDANLERLASRLYERVDWRYWTAPRTRNADGLIRHGRGRDGRMFRGRWDRMNGETVFMYVLAAGAHPSHAVRETTWSALRPFYGTVAGHHFNNADLGLFVFQYGLDLLDLRAWRPPGGVDLAREAAIAAVANRDACREQAEMFQTYKNFWGLSAGDGPGDLREPDAYRIYAPQGPVDGTAHLTATLGSIGQAPDAVLENLRHALGRAQAHPLGRYGLSAINLDRRWVGRDMVGIDAGAAVLAIDNLLADGRIRRVFHAIPAVECGLNRLGFLDTRVKRQAS